MASSTLARAVWKVSLPLILVEATETFDHLIDTLFLARVGITELGTIAVADSVMLLCLVAPLALVDGLQILTARRAARHQPEAVGDVFTQGLLLVLLLGTVFALLLRLTAPVMASSFIESSAVGASMNAYLQIDAYTIPLSAFTFAASVLLISLGRTAALVPATMILTVSDVLLN